MKTLYLSRVALIAGLLAASTGARTVANFGESDWPMIGHDSTNTRSQRFEHRIKPANANRLAVKWVSTIAGDVCATAAVVDGAVYGNSAIRASPSIIERPSRPLTRSAGRRH